MAFIKLPSNSEKILLELIRAENPTQTLNAHYESRSMQERRVLDGIVRELKECGYINVKWSDNMPLIVTLNNSARTYGKQLTEYGAQKPSYTTFTSTGSVGYILSKNKSKIKVISSTIGDIVDMGIKDAYNMGAVMAPSAVKVLINHLKNTKSSIDDYDLILTGDLGKYGSTLFKTLLKQDYNIIIKNHIDAGSIIYKSEQEKYSGGSGPVCLPLILFNNILQNKKYKKIIVIGTGSLHSPTLVNQKHSIPSTSHLISLEVE